jgi:TatD DNase family protein
LTETDGPFVERDGQPLRPRDVGHTVADLAELQSLTVKAMEDVILQNLRCLVGA